MRKRRFVVGLECKSLLEEAIEKRLPVTVTKKSEDNWQIYKSNLLALQNNRIILAMPTPQVPGSPMEPAPGQEMAVTFKKGYNKCLFVTRVIAQEQYELEPGMTTACLILYRPEQIEKIRRRAYNRTTPPDNLVIPATVWPSGRPNDKFHAVLSNISAGGIGLQIPPAGTTLDHVRDFNGGLDAQPQRVTVESVNTRRLEENAQFEIHFFPFPPQEDSNHQMGPIHVQGRLRHVSEGENESTMLGFQLVGLELTEEGRSVLRRISRVVNMYERQKPLSEHTNLNRMR